MFQLFFGTILHKFIAWDLLIHVHKNKEGQLK